MKTLPIDKTVRMLKDLLAGKDVVAVTAGEKATKAALLKDIAKAKKKGYQIEIPSI